MARFGSSSGYGSDNLSATTDPQGNPIVSPDNSFAASPLGYAARAQSLYGIANPTFNLTPPEPLGTVSSANQIPYWDLYNDGDIIPTMYFDSTAETWDVDLNPSGADSGATLTLKTRSYLLNDTNLSLRQKAYLAITKNGSFSGTAQWNLSLGAEYFTFAGVSLGSYAIGTVSHSATWTSISGTTTSGGTAIDPSAYYVDLSVTMTTLGTVTDTTTARINSLLLATSQTATGSFLVTQTFTSSGTWTRPSGVNFVDVLAVGAGGGGGCGDAGLDNVVGGGVRSGGKGGGAGAFVIARDLYVGDQTTVSVGVGSGGNGAANSTASKVSGSTTRPVNATGGTSTSGGNSTFGTYVTAGGGQGGGNGNSGATGGGGTASSIVYGATLQDGAAAGLGTVITKFPYVTAIGTGVAAGSAGTLSISGTTPTTRVYLATGGSPGAAYANSAAGGAGGGGAFINIYSTGGTTRATGTATSVGGSGAFGMFGSGGNGGGLTAGTSVATTVANVGDSATIGSGGSGGAGGAVISDRFTGAGTANQYRDAAATAISQAGASGGAGFVIVAWTA
jgi:hypothetical protein